MRVPGVIAAALVMLACLSGCPAEVQQPSVLGPASPSPAVETTSSPEPTPPTEPSTSAAVAAPVLPPEAKAQTAAGAIAFVRYHFATIDYAYATGDTAPLAAASHPECAPCAAVKGMIDATYSAGGSWQHENTNVIRIVVPEGEPLGAVNVGATYSSEASNELDATGREVRVFPAAVVEDELLVLVPDGSSWLMFDYGGQI